MSDRQRPVVFILGAAKRQSERHRTHLPAAVGLHPYPTQQPAHKSHQEMAYCLKTSRQAQQRSMRNTHTPCPQAHIQMACASRLNGVHASQATSGPATWTPCIVDVR